MKIGLSPFKAPVAGKRISVQEVVIDSGRGDWKSAARGSITALVNTCKTVVLDAMKAGLESYLATNNIKVEFSI